MSDERKNIIELLELLSLGLRNLKIDVTDDRKKKLIDFILLLDKWNQAYSLTSVRNMTNMVTHHLLDSIVAYSFIKDCPTILDLGTGPGIPGIPLAILMPNTMFTLLDSSKKKLKFVKHAINCLELANIEVINSRVEDFKPINKFHLVMTRAFASLDKFVTVAGHLCLDTGSLLAYKGDNVQEELKALPDDFRVIRLEKVIVPNLDKSRYLVFIEKGRTLG